MIADNVASRTKTNGETARPRNLVSEMSRVERRHAVNYRMLANEGNNNRRRQHVIMQPFAWAEQLTVSVFVNVLNDDEHEVEDDPSATHHADRGASEQIWRSVSICHEGFWARESANDQDLVTQWGSGRACGEIIGPSS